MELIKIPRVKILKVCFVLSNGLDPEEHYFKIESFQPDFDNVAVGKFCILRSNLSKNMATVGRITGVIQSEKSIERIFKKTPNIPNAMILIDFDILDFIEGMEDID